MLVRKRLYYLAVLAYLVQIQVAPLFAPEALMVKQETFNLQKRDRYPPGALMILYGPYENPRGYLFIMYYVDGKLTSKSYARYILEQEGHDLTGKQVHHKDKNPKNNSLDNLQIVTIQEHATIHAEGPILVTVECGYCSHEFDVELKRYNQFKKAYHNLFCSKRCAAIHKGKLSGVARKLKAGRALARIA